MILITLFNPILTPIFNRLWVAVGMKSCEQRFLGQVTSITVKKAIFRLTTLLFSEFEALEFEPRRYNDAGDCVFVEGHFTFRHRQTGKIADSDWVARFDMQDDRIVGGQFYENTASVAEARKIT